MPAELIEQGLNIAGHGNDLFWYMNWLSYKSRPLAYNGRPRALGNLPFVFKQEILVAWPPRAKSERFHGMAGVEEQLQQLVAEVKAVPGGRFLTPEEMAGLFEPQNARPVEKDEFRRIADKLIASGAGRPPDFVDLVYCVKQNVDYPQGVGRAAGCDFGGFDETVASRSASTPQLQASAPAGGSTRTILSDSISDADH